MSKKRPTTKLEVDIMATVAVIAVITLSVGPTYCIITALITLILLLIKFMRRTTIIGEPNFKSNKLNDEH